MNKKLNTIELFAGCGGLLDGFEQSGYYRTLACVEWNKKPIEVLIERLKTKYNYQNADEISLRFDIQRTDELLNGWNNDIEYVNSVGLKSIIDDKIVDLIVGGPPCQAYSIAGRIQDKDGMKNDYRNYLFESYLKIVDEFKPKVIVFENVEGILSAKPQELKYNDEISNTDTLENNEDTFCLAQNEINIIDKIKHEFNISGYEIIDDIRKYALIDLSQYSVPQQRKRVILVGLNKDVFTENRQNILIDFYQRLLPKYKGNKILTVKNAIYDLPKLFPSNKEYTVEGKKKKYSHSPHKTVVKDHYPRYHNKRDIEIFRTLAFDIESGENKYSDIESLKKLYFEKTGKKSNIHKYNVLKWNEPSNTIPAHLKKDGLRHIHPDYKQARSITVREAARIQTFDDDFEFSGLLSADYEMIGNAVPPKFALRLANAIYDLIKEQEII
ncbi:DNA cytosine methyltransferase [Sedimentibacter saalensis]|uniref:Cytosine-specific methyltransferase n=1 Tax=Sedimentibacter saalensis TaxID=130788 RepID=A0A562JH44_9FIRM|nr:DNA cytosine methyltransferase [Sedimentibacter saalensis]TWH82576.1 DNA (cytosine-5)-methyltransferase 1 [Sedimentibacter saalensis]